MQKLIGRNVGVGAIRRGKANYMYVFTVHAMYKIKAAILQGMGGGGVTPNS